MDSDNKPNLTQQIKELGEEIKDDVVAAMGGSILLDAESQAMLARAGATMAESTILMTTTDIADVRAHLQWRFDAADATIANLTVANVVAVQTAFRSSVAKAVTKATGLTATALSGMFPGGSIAATIFAGVIGNVAGALGDAAANAVIRPTPEA